MKKLYVNELSKHINNDNIVSQNVFDIVSKYKQSMNLGDIRKSEKGEFFITPDIKKVMICFMLYPQRYMPSIIENGLMKKGIIVRILVLPDHTDDAIKIIDYLYKRYGNSIIITYYISVIEINNSMLAIFLLLWYNFTK